MSNLLIILLILSAWHFVYEAILLPGYRMRLRNELFALRDTVRNLHLERGSRELSPELELLHDGINYYLTRLHRITPTVVLQIEAAYRQNEDIRATIDARRRLIEQADDSRIREISQHINTVISQALVANIGGWMIYIIPVVIAISLFSWLKRLSAELFMAPSRTVDQFMNDGLKV